MSIIRVGLAQTRNFADGYDAIFGDKKAPAAKASKPAKAKAVKKPKKAKKK